jgi:hypothetical protein
MATNDEQLEKGLDGFLGIEPTAPAPLPNKVVKKKSELVEKVDVDKKLVVEDGRELLREITYNRY